MTRCPDFTCPECRGNGRVNVSGNEPRARHEQCDVCNGCGELDASDYLGYALSAVKDCRRLSRRYKASNPKFSRALRNQAREWIVNAKKARAVLLTERHHGSAHIGSAA